MLQENKIKIGKYNINYLKVGHGAHNVLCMPGTLGSIWTDFKPQIEGFDREKFTLIVWDPPGFGKSRPPEREFGTNYYSQDVDTALEFMKALNIPKFSLMGWCYGGTSSIILAIKYPEAVHKLVVWGARACIRKEEVEFYKKLKDVSAWSEEMRRPKIELYGEERFAKLCVQAVDVMDTVQQINDGIILSPEDLKKICCPTLIFHGEKDPIIDKANMHAVHNGIQGSKLHVYPEGKHNVHLRFAEDFNQRVQEFLLED